MFKKVGQSRPKQGRTVRRDKRGDTRAYRGDLANIAASKKQQQIRAGLVQIRVSRVYNHEHAISQIYQYKNSKKRFCDAEGCQSP